MLFENLKIIKSSFQNNKIICSKLRNEFQSEVDFFIFFLVILGIYPLHKIVGLKLSWSFSSSRQIYTSISSQCVDSDKSNKVESTCLKI